MHHERNKAMDPYQQVPFNIDEKPSLRKIFKTSRMVQQDKIKLWENAVILQVKIPLNEAVIKTLLPAVLKPDPSCSATLFIANYTRTAFTLNYMEAAILIHVRSLFGREGVHCCWMVVDDDTALIYGRELLGFPKKMADFAFEEKEGEVTAGVTRRGTEIVKINATKIEKETDPEPVIGNRFYNVSGMGQFYLINPVWCFKTRETIHESWKATVSLKLKHSYFDPIADLAGPLPETLQGRISTIDIISSRVMYPVGLAGIRYLYNSYNLRFR